VKFLLDENLSYRLVARLDESFPGTASVHQVGLQSEPDIVIWKYAMEHGFAILSKDDHFRQFSFAFGHPPKVVWLDVGNAATEGVAELLLHNEKRLDAFFGQDEDSLFILRLNLYDSRPS